jgi:hypothetical protein
LAVIFSIALFDDETIKNETIYLLHELVRDNLNTHEQIAKREEIDNSKKTSWQNGRSRNEYPTFEK